MDTFYHNQFSLLLYLKLLWPDGVWHVEGVVFIKDGQLIWPVVFPVHVDSFSHLGQRQNHGVWTTALWHCRYRRAWKIQLTVYSRGDESLINCNLLLHGSDKFNEKINTDIFIAYMEYIELAIFWHRGLVYFTCIKILLWLITIVHTKYQQNQHLLFWDITTNTNLACQIFSKRSTPHQGHLNGWIYIYYWLQSPNPNLCHFLQ